MRGKITDQDLTDYALNDGLEPSERLYVESMLAISEECRQDIYRNIELSQMLETGFERTYGEATPMLTDEQRHALLNPPVRHFRAAIHRAAAVLAMAACAALALANPSLWHMENHRRSLAQVSTQVSRMMSDSITAGSDSSIAPLVTMPSFSESVDTFLQTTMDAVSQPSAICTPPTLDTSDFTDFR